MTTERIISDTIIYRGHTIEIVHDDDPMHPRKDCDNFGKMVCAKHRNHRLGDEQFDDVDEFMFSLVEEVHTFKSRNRAIQYWEDLTADIWDKNGGNYGAADDTAREMMQRVLEKHYVMLPLYIYEHGGITMSSSPFSCGWDSGQVGWIYISRKKALEEFNAGRKKPLKNWTKKVQAYAEGVLEQEVKTYDAWLTGDCYGYIVYKGAAEEIFTGWETKYDVSELTELDSCWGYIGEEDYCIESAKHYIDRRIEQEIEEHIKQLKVWIRNRVPLNARHGLTLWDTRRD